MRWFCSRSGAPRGATPTTSAASRERVAGTAGTRRGKRSTPDRQQNHSRLDASWRSIVRPTTGQKAGRRYPDRRTIAAGRTADAGTRRADATRNPHRPHRTLTSPAAVHDQPGEPVAHQTAQPVAAA